MSRINYKNYQEYLKSPAWRAIKKAYSKRFKTDCCMICHYKSKVSKEFHHHHFVYSKDWNDDSEENLIYICDQCHEVLHHFIKHDSESIELRDYMSKAFRHIFRERAREQEEIQTHHLALALRGGNCEITSDKTGQPYKIHIKDATILSMPLADKLLTIQRKGA